jgi:hypothetical protein
MTTNVKPHPVPVLDQPPAEGSQSVSPELLIGRHVENARRQLADGRERLKGARRRVVQLEDALCGWERLAGEMRAMRDRRAA